MKKMALVAVMDVMSQCSSVCMDHFKADVWFSPAAVVADSDAIQASDGEGTQGQSDEDDVKHSVL